MNPADAASLQAIWRTRSAPPRKPGRGLSPDFVFMGIHAWSAQLAHAALTTTQEAKQITDAAAKTIQTAQRSERGFKDITGVTRRSVTISKGDSPYGYEASIGPGMPGTGQGPPVARFLVFGTVKMSRKWDLFGLSQPGIDSWQAKMEDLAKL